MLKMNKVFKTPNNRLLMMIALLSIVVLAAACGQTSTPSAKPSANPSAPVVASPAPLATAIPQSTSKSSEPLPVNNCALLSNDEVGKVLGEDVTDARMPAPDGSICAYQTKTFILELTFLHKFGGFANSVKYMENIKTNDAGVLVVPGLGDEAFYHGAPAYRILLVRKGETVYGFGVRNASDQSLSSPDNAQASEKILADLLISRVP